MPCRHCTAIVFALLMTLLWCAAPATSASIKDRMTARLPTIIALKDQGVIGENTQGYLEYRTGNKPDQQVVEAENKDRRLVYAQIAKNQGVDIALVGQRRAKQIVEKGNPGHWFRNADGTWYQKK
jgi:uncharacterized protein YdbL (DUF1318 family)